MSASDGLKHFSKVLRTQFDCKKEKRRTVYVSEFVHRTDKHSLADFVADRAPYLYREPAKVLETIKDKYFLSMVRETLRKLPTAEGFRASHFGEILSAIFGEDVGGLIRLYSKLACLTAENQNALKIDIVFYRQGSNPIEFIFSSVKLSPKTCTPGESAGHDESCYADLFRSFNDYTDDDLQFDIEAAKDRISLLPPEEAQRVRAALLPYATRYVTYAGFVVIDTSTKNDAEMGVLATRKNGKEFDIDVLCVESLPTVINDTFKIVEGVFTSCFPKKN